MYDLIVIGAGPGGYEAALYRSAKGLNVCLIEKEMIGGTCLNKGCIPTKALLHGTGKWHELDNIDVIGINISEKEFSYGKLADYKDNIVKKLRNNVEMMLKKAKVTVINGFGKLIDEHTVNAGDEIISGKNIIIATGSRPADIKINGAENALNSDEFLELRELKGQNWTVIGGGVIGMEMAFVLEQAGKTVTVLEMTDNILTGTDQSILRWLNRSLKKNNIKVITSAKVKEITADKILYEKEGKQAVLESDNCLIAAGRKNNIDNIGLELTGVKTDGRNIVADKYLRTNIDNIYAIGDVTGIRQLAHVASYQAKIAVNNITGGNEEADYESVPSCIFTVPVISAVGKSASQLTSEGREFISCQVNAGTNGKLVLSQHEEGTALIYCDADTHEILGAQIIREGSSEMINEITLAMKKGCKAEDIASMIHPHPTAGEIVHDACEKIC